MGWAETYNVTKTLAAFPCAQPDPVIMAVTLVPAIAPALIEWASFGCRDLLKFRLGKGTPCGRAMKAQAAKAIPPKYANAVGTLLKWEHRFSYAGQMFLLSDLASDTVSRWTTLAYQLNGCPDALEGTTWGLEYETAQGFLPNTPEYVGGRLTSVKGNPGVAWPTGAMVPRGWYFSAEISMKAVGVFDRLTAGLKVWVRKEGHHRYDFPANEFAGGYPFLQTNAHYFLPEQHNDTNGPTAYNFMAEADRDSLLTELSANCQCTPFPQSNWALSPLSCIQNLASKRVPNPAGMNYVPREPLIHGVKPSSFLPKPQRRGPPEAKPRSKK